MDILQQISYYYSQILTIKNIQDRNFKRKDFELNQLNDLKYLEEIKNRLQIINRYTIHEQLFAVKECLKEIKESKYKSYYYLKIGKIVLRMKQIDMSINYLKKGKKMAKKYGYEKLRMQCYKGLGYSFMFLREYRIASYYFHRMLQMAWKMGNRNYEISAYDCLGLIYYQQEEHLKAYFFFHKHQKYCL